MLVFNFLLITFNILYAEISPDSSIASSTIVIEDLQDSPKKSKYQFSGELTLEAKSIDLGEQRDRQSPGVQNLSVGIAYQFQPQLKAYIELLGEQYQDQNQIYLGEVYAEYNIFSSPDIRVKAGNMYYAYGILTGREGELTQRPSYYSDLLVERRGIDLGATVSAQPFESLPIEASYSYYSGQTLRQGDQASQNAPVNPQVLTLSYTPSFLTAKVGHLRRRYVDRPSFEGSTASVQSSIFSFWNDRLKVSAMSELWMLNYRRADGLQRRGTTQLFGSQIEFLRAFYRLIASQEKWVANRGGSNDVTSNFVLHGIGIRINEHIHLEYQKVLTNERQTNVNLQTRDEEAFRILMRL